MMLEKTLYHLQKVLWENGSKQDELKDLEPRLSGLTFSDDDELWIEEEEPLYIW
ncbi:MAG: hypothetical protein ACFFE2_04750 [Candidatus Thorarchaeota archaeon]